MKINVKKGNKSPEDKMYYVEMNNEPFSIIKFAVLNNLLAQNEYNLYKETINRTGNFFFAMAMKEAIEMGKQGIDFRSWLNNKENFDAWCKKYYFVGVNKSRAWNEINNEIQLTLEGFEDGL